MRGTRLATEDEITSICNYFANVHWEESILYANTLGADNVKLGYDKFLAKEIQEQKELLGDLIIVKEFKTGLKLFSFYLGYENEKENLVFGTPIALLYAEGNFEDISDADFFNFKEDFKSLRNAHLPKNPGRPKRPSDKSILGFQKVDSLISEGVLVDEACKEAKIAKSTYYRVKQFLIDNHQIFKTKYQR